MVQKGDFYTLEGENENRQKKIKMLHYMCKISYLT